MTAGFTNFKEFNLGNLQAGPVEMPSTIKGIDFLGCIARSDKKGIPYDGGNNGLTGWEQCTEEWEVKLAACGGEALQLHDGTSGKLFCPDRNQPLRCRAVTCTFNPDSAWMVYTRPWMKTDYDLETPSPVKDDQKVLSPVFISGTNREVPLYEGYTDIHYLHGAKVKARIESYLQGLYDGVDMSNPMNYSNVRLARDAYAA